MRGQVVLEEAELLRIWHVNDGEIVEMSQKQRVALLVLLLVLVWSWCWCQYRVLGRVLGGAKRAEWITAGVVDDGGVPAVHGVFVCWLAWCWAQVPDGESWMLGLCSEDEVVLRWR